MKPKIYDCFTFFNELDLLEIRLEYLYDSVDFFVLVESNKTHTDILKPLHFQANKERYSKYNDKIIHVVADDCPPRVNTWTIENFHRNSIMRGLARANDEDVIMISDLDEIPHTQNFPLFTGPVLENKYFAMSQLHYVYYLNVHVYEKHWVGSVVTQKKSLKHNCPQDFRNCKDKMKRIACGGWHLSYLGGASSIFDKFKTSCDVLPHETVPEPDEIKKLLEKRIKEGQFNIRHVNNNSEPVCLVNNPYLPWPAANSKYEHLFLKDISEIK